MKTITREKLNDAEAKRLAKFIEEKGGEVKVGGIFGVTPFTVSRTLNRRTAPSPLFRKALIGAGIVKE